MVGKSDDGRSTDRFVASDLPPGSAYEATVLIDQDGRVHHADAESCRLLGYSQEEMLGLHVHDLAPDIDTAEWPDRWTRLREARSVVFETRYRTGDGRILYVEISLKYVDYGGTAYALAQVRDISERRRKEEARLASLHFFECMDQVNRAIQAAGSLEQMMRDVLDLMLAMLDVDRAYLLYPCDPDAPTWSVPMERTRPEYPGAHVEQAVIPTGPDVARSFRAMLEADGPVTFGLGGTHPLVEEVSARFGIRSFMAQAVYPKVGAPWQFGVHQCSRDRVWTGQEQRLFREVARRLADGLTSLLTLRDLQESESRYRRIVSTANEGIWALDAQDRTTFVNPRMAQLLGYDVEEMTGRPLVSFVCPGPEQQGWSPERLRGRLEQFELCLRHHDGHPVWVLGSAARTVDEHQRHQGTFVMFTDITAKRRAEGELHRLNDELEQRVCDRTAELQASHTELERAYRELAAAQDQILQQEKLATIGQLAAGIAHEINTPAQYIGGNLTFLDDGFARLITAVGEHAAGAVPADDDLAYWREEIPRALRESVDGVHRIADIVAALKELARPGTQRSERVDLERLVRSTVEVARKEWAQVADLDLDLDLDPGMPAVVGRSDELRQALLQLVANAAHAVAAGTVAGGDTGRIAIVTRRRGRWAEIEVRDNADGVPDELRHRVFDPFVTADEVGAGQGLGLAIAHTIVTVGHGGELSVESVPGVGATFTVRLPLST